MNRFASTSVSSLQSCSIWSSGKRGARATVSRTHGERERAQGAASGRCPREESSRVRASTCRADHARPAIGKQYTHKDANALTIPPQRNDRRATPLAICRAHGCGDRRDAGERRFTRRGQGVLRLRREVLGGKGLPGDQWRSGGAPGDRRGMKRTSVGEWSDVMCRDATGTMYLAWHPSPTRLCTSEFVSKQAYWFGSPSRNCHVVQNDGADGPITGCSERRNSMRGGISVRCGGNLRSGRAHVQARARWVGMRPLRPPLGQRASGRPTLPGPSCEP